MGSDVLKKSIIFSSCGQGMLPEEQSLNYIEANTLKKKGREFSRQNVVGKDAMMYSSCPRG